MWTRGSVPKKQWTATSLADIPPMLILSGEEAARALRNKTKDTLALAFGLCCHFDEVVHADYDADFHRYHVYFADHQDLIVWKLTYL